MSGLANTLKDYQNRRLSLNKGITRLERLELESYTLLPPLP